MIQGGDSFRLIVRRGPQPNQIYELSKEILTIGRDITNDIVINDPEVSRHHLRLTRGAGGFTIEDLGSTNGTFVNGQRLTGARPLRNGELVGLGETVTLSYESAAGAGAMAGTMPSQGVDPRYSPPGSVAPTIQPGQQSPYAPPPQQQVGSSDPNYVPFAPPGQQPGMQGMQPGMPPQQPGMQGMQQPGMPGGGARYNTPPQPQLGSTGQPIYPGASQQPPPLGAPPAPGYGASNAPYSPSAPGFGSDYDPYAAREEEPRNNTRLILLGCGGLALFCCCASVIGAVAVDQLCLWDRIPIVYDILRAFGYVMAC
jgi:hypothetical protein